jgi:hypothetical protein
VIDYHKNEDIDLFLLDNNSTDGTWEYIQDNKIPSKRVYTNDTFDMNLLVKYKCEIIHKIKPDWVINMDNDMFLMTPAPLIKLIKDVDDGGFSIISTPFIRFFDTGEKITDSDPRKVYFNYRQDRDFLLKIHRYKNFVNYFADFPVMDANHQIIQTDMIYFLDYGNTRGKKKREDIYQRTIRAWNNGLPKNFGEHYIEASERNWLWSKDELDDIRKSKYWELINYKFNGE